MVRYAVINNEEAGGVIMIQYNDLLNCWLSERAFRSLERKHSAGCMRHE